MEQTDARHGSGVSFFPPVPTSPPASSAAAVEGSRLSWLDRAKGIGIVLVVAGHAAGGLIDLAALRATPWLIDLFFGIYTFHMALFFFLSALLIDRRVRRDGAMFFKALLRRIVYPYALWSVIQLTVISLAAAHVNSPVLDYWGDVAAIPYMPVSQFWFLYALAILQLLSLLLLPTMSRWMFLGAMVLFWLVAWVVPLPLPLGQAAHYAIFFGIGVAIGPEVGAPVARLRGWPGVVIAILFLLAVVVAADLALAPVLHGVRPSAGTIAGAAWRIELTPVAILGTLIVLILAASATGATARALSLLGRASMMIYLTHVILIAGSRILIVHAIGPLEASAILPILVAIGIGGPFAVRAIARRLRIASLLALD